jgi:amino acid transporter
MTDQAEQPPPRDRETFTKEGVFVRKSTGLVREVSPFSALLFNVLPTVPGVGLAISVFFVFGVFPGVHILSAYWLTGLIALAIALPFAFLGTAFPRSGGDYILVSRSIGPPFGLASSFSLLIAAVMATAFVAVTFAKFGIVPAIQTIGFISGSKSWLNTAATLSSKGYTVLFSLIMLAIAFFLAGIRLRTAMRFQNWSFAIAGVGLLAGLITMLAVSRSSFITKYNSVAGAHAYQTIIAAAHKAHLAAPGTSWSNTVPVIGVISFLFIFSWWSAHYGGEISRPRNTSTFVVMTGSIVIFVVVYIVMTAALSHLVGNYFLAASSASTTATVPSYWFTFVAIASKSVPFAVFIMITYLFWFPMWTWLQIAQPIRAMFAWAFDGVFPKAVANVDDRTHAPLVALVITAVLSIAATFWAVYSGNFLTILSTVTLFNLTPMWFVSLGAILLPFLKPDLWKTTPLARRYAGIPLLSIVGLLGFAAVSFVFYLYMHYSGLGIAHPVRTVIAMAACIVIGFAIYFVGAAIQKRRGIDVSLNYAELPGE